jgi:NAD(P)H-dependent FMN reductase
MQHFAARTQHVFDTTIFTGLKSLPPFDPDLSLQHTPEAVLTFRKSVEEADGIIICTPEYVFSIPAGLKNAIEWCVATTVFSDKPTGIITASASGQKGHEALQLIMKTVMARFIPETTLLIQGIKGKIGEDGNITDNKTEAALAGFIDAFMMLVSGT